MGTEREDELWNEIRPYDYEGEMIQGLYSMGILNRTFHVYEYEDGKENRGFLYRTPYPLENSNSWKHFRTNDLDEAKRFCEDRAKVLLNRELDRIDRLGIKLDSDIEVKEEDEVLNLRIEPLQRFKCDSASKYRGKGEVNIRFYEE